MKTSTLAFSAATFLVIACVPVRAQQTTGVPGAADNSGGTIATAPHIMRNDERVEIRPSLGFVAIECHGNPRIVVRRPNGALRCLRAGTGPRIGAVCPDLTVACNSQAASFPLVFRPLSAKRPSSWLERAGLF